MSVGPAASRSMPARRTQPESGDLRVACLSIAFLLAGLSTPVAADSQPDGPHREAVATASVSAAGARRSPERLAALDRELDGIATVLRAAHFRTTLALADDARELFDAAAPGSALARRRARLEVMAATAELALGHRGRARQALERASRADPRLALDETTTSPRIVSLWRSVREGAARGNRAAAQRTAP